MNLEQAIQENTAAILALATAIRTMSNTDNVILAAAKGAAVDFGADAQASDPKLVKGEPFSGLPKGERNEEYYLKHIAPSVVSVAKRDRQVAVDIIESYGVKKGKEVPVDKWDEFFSKLQEALV